MWDGNMLLKSSVCVYVCVCAIVGVMKFGVCVLKVNKRNTKKRKKTIKNFSHVSFSWNEAKQMRFEEEYAQVCVCVPCVCLYDEDVYG